MGQAVGRVISDSERRNETDVVEQLRSYQRMVSAKLEAQRMKISKEAFNDSKLPILSVVSTTQNYSLEVTASTALKKTVEKCLKRAIGGEYLDGLTNLLSDALGELLGNTTGGEHERKDNHVAFANNSLLRVDCYMYKYQFQSEGIRSKCKNIFAYYIQVGVLDLIKVNPQIVLYELTSSVGDARKLEETKEKLTMMADFTRSLYRVVTALQSHDKRPLSSGRTSNQDEEEEEERASKYPRLEDEPRE